MPLIIKPASGLSPLARGTRKTPRRQSGTPRFIPAGAGNTRLPGEPEYRRTVYPRWRGEHGTLASTFPTNFGLSPLARGTPPPSHRSRSRRRFIPAGAGNTKWLFRRISATPVYPRWRGEHITIDSISRRDDGLSPLARGTPWPARGQS